MKDAQDKETVNRILQLEQRIAALEKEIALLKEKPVTMSDIERDMEIDYMAKEFAKGNKEPHKAWNKKQRQTA